MTLSAVRAFCHGTQSQGTRNAVEVGPVRSSRPGMRQRQRRRLDLGGAADVRVPRRGRNARRRSVSLLRLPTVHPVASLVPLERPHRGLDRPRPLDRLCSWPSCFRPPAPRWTARARHRTYCAAFDLQQSEQRHRAPAARNSHRSPRATIEPWYQQAGRHRSPGRLSALPPAWRAGLPHRARVSATGQRFNRRRCGCRTEAKRLAPARRETSTSMMTFR